tara:strand:- start:2448 stop:2687 length:240 start_codon:yes stop_codon:yes gene_type:complete
MHIERTRHLERRRRRRRRKAHSNVLSSGALQQISHLRLEHGRVVSFEARVAFLARARVRACIVRAKSGAWRTKKEPSRG